MKREILEKLGLTKSEIDIYLALIELGNSLASKIAKKCALHRTNVYDSLDKLIKKGLVSFIIRENRKYFFAAEPKKLLKILEGKKEEIKKEENELKGIISELKKKKQLSEEKIEAQIYKGKEGFRTVMEDILESSKEWLIIGGSGKSVELEPYYMPNLFRRIKKLGVSLKILHVDTSEAKKLYSKLSKEKHIKSKFLPPEMKNMTVIHIYADKVAIIPITPYVVKEPTIFLIKNKENADSFRNYFKALWRKR